MSPFEFSFTLFGLVLGLAMAEVLGGFARVLRARSIAYDATTTIRIGWFTPALALVVALDLITSWNLAWQTLGTVPVNPATLTFGLCETGLYYFAATLLWPDAPAGWPDLDAWFGRHKMQIGAAIALANLGFSVVYWRYSPAHYANAIAVVVQLIYIAAAASLTATRAAWQSTLALTVMLGILIAVILMSLL